MFVLINISNSSFVFLVCSLFIIYFHYALCWEENCQNLFDFDVGELLTGLSEIYVTRVAKTTKYFLLFVSVRQFA